MYLILCLNIATYVTCERSHISAVAKIGTQTLGLRE